jgi:hypothetical protein
MLIGWPEDGGMMSSVREEGKSDLVGNRGGILTWPVWVPRERDRGRSGFGG